jgi:hypothetical protein
MSVVGKIINSFLNYVIIKHVFDQRTRKPLGYLLDTHKMSFGAVQTSLNQSAHTNRRLVLFSNDPGRYRFTSKYLFGLTKHAYDKKYAR